MKRVGGRRRDFLLRLSEGRGADGRGRSGVLRRLLCTNQPGRRLVSDSVGTISSFAFATETTADAAEEEEEDDEERGESDDEKEEEGLL